MCITHWDAEYSAEDSDEIIRNLALWHLSQVIETTQRERIASLCRTSDYRSLCDFTLPYRDLRASDAAHLRQVLAFYQKRTDLDLNVDRKEAAFRKFVEAEQLCLETNRIFRAWGRGHFQFAPRVESIFHRASRIISDALGDVPSLKDLKLRFGPGATTQLKKKEASPRAKLAQTLCCSEDLLPTVSEVIEEMPGWIPDEAEIGSLSDFCADELDWSDPYPDGMSALDELEEFGPAKGVDYSTRLAVVPVRVEPGILSFVPKSAKTDRAVVKEPMLNTMCQLGIGSYLAKRLKTRLGMDITDQSRNQELARIGSLTGELATLDLSSASDTIAVELIRHLLPVDWDVFLSRFRTGTIIFEQKTAYDDISINNVFRLQKFSSMGNGFTFPLETLIFSSLAIACCEACNPHIPSRKALELVSVYGDDIIVPVNTYALLEEVLVASGFLLNTDKSFASGPFRESCGADYLSGINIRPCYLKGSLTGCTAFLLHNHYAERGLSEPASLVLDFIPEPLRLWGPNGYGDGHLISDCDLEPYRRKDGWSGFIFDTYVNKHRTDFKIRRGDWVLPSYSIYASPPRGGLPGFSQEEIGKISRTLPTWRVNAGEWVWNDSEPFQTLWEREDPSNKRSPKTVMGVVLPGTDGYKRISIYTLK